MGDDATQSVGRRPRGRVFLAAIVGVLGAAAAAVGFIGVDQTRCQLQLGPCPRVVDDSRQIELQQIVLDASRRSEVVWSLAFVRRGLDYAPTRVVLYDEPTETGCGPIPAGASPVYCQRDGLIYIDLAFFDVIVERYGAGGDTIPAFVVAHEISHHVQNLTGEFDRYLGLLQAYDEMSEEERATVDTPNQLLVRLELQADCLAGVVAARAQALYQLLDTDDLIEAVAGATQLGDDNVQLAESGFINEDAFTHGTGEQRRRWLETGFTAANMDACDTWSPAFDTL